MDNLSKNLVHLIKKANLSENELARRTGVPQQVISRIARGINKNPKITTLTLLARYFGILTSELLGEMPLRDITKEFVTELTDDSMEPNFPKGTFLTIDPDKKPHEGSFVLLKLHEKKIIVLRQVSIKNGQIHMQCFNPKSEDHELKKVDPKDQYLGLVIHAKINF